MWIEFVISFVEETDRPPKPARSGNINSLPGMNLNDDPIMLEYFTIRPLPRVTTPPHNSDWFD